MTDLLNDRQSGTGRDPRHSVDTSSAQGTITVALVNDYDVVVQGLARMIEGQGDRLRVVELDLQSPIIGPVDIALFDTFAAPLDWQPRLSSMARDPHIGAVAVYSFMTDPRAVEDSLAAGADGFLAKSLPAEALVEGIESIAGGHRVVDLGARDGGVAGDHWPAEGVGLSPREAEMLSLIVRGYSNEEIARSRYLSPNTVKSYIREAYRKIGVTTRAQAVAWGMRNGLEPAH